MTRLARIALLLSVALAAVVPPTASAAPLAQTSTPPAKNPQVQRILATLTPAERVGQLFIVTFEGSDVSEASAIYDLITKHHIGGVVLSAANDNFADVDQFTAQLRSLTSGLQVVTSGAVGTGTATPASSGQFIPLFIALQTDDDSATGMALMPALSGLTPVPNHMTLGASWKSEHAHVAGQILGQELSALGINMLFSPILDVIENPQPASAADLGARAFGGDPYWVGVMGKAFTEGVHAGSAGRVALVARHFPGYGASDRTLEEQVPTISKSLAQLVAVDLAPFFAATAGGVDALLVSHTRYRGFQGNIRDTTRPISFDQQALTVLLSLPELAGWRAAGGLTVSDALGVRAVRRFYDITGRTFPAFNIARDAFLAGNDVLYISQFSQSGQLDQAETLKVVLAQFVQKYNEDTAFALRVDEAVARIIALKLKLYGDFTLSSVLALTSLDLLGTNRPATFTATRDAATLISPTPAELADRLPTPPTANQQIIFLTDVRLQRQCSECALRSVLSADTLQQAVERFYGSQGTGEVLSSNLSSYTFAELANFLDGRPALPTPTAEPPVAEGQPTSTPVPVRPSVNESLSNAEWVVVSLLDVKSTIQNSNAFGRLLAERPDLLRDKRVILFSFDAPYYLDTTEVAQLTAYYGLYGKTSAAVEVAARILFQEITPSGASPVSISAVSYNLLEATQPDPRQVIQLFIDTPDSLAATVVPSDVTPTPPAFAVNNVVPLRTGMILDRNGHVVPDGTVVRFFVNYVAEGLTTQLAQATTVNGIARATLRLDRIGLLEVSVTSEPALTSFTLQFNAQEAPSTPVVITPTPGPTDTVEPTYDVTLSATPEITPTPADPRAAISSRVTGGDLLIALFALATLGAVGWRLTHSRADAVSSGVKLVLATAIGIWAMYDFYALNLPGAAVFDLFGRWAVTTAVWTGGAIGLWLGWVRWGRK